MERNILDCNLPSFLDNIEVSDNEISSLPGIEKQKDIRSKRKRSDVLSCSIDHETITDISVNGINWDPSRGDYHTGKWPIEEERYANRLVLEFEAGILEDCNDGVTLRSYLARTLRCAPMRVSKKFAGKCIGSKAFQRREGDRQKILDKISAGELNIGLIQKRQTQKLSTSARRSSKAARTRSISDVTDDDNSSRSSSYTNEFNASDNESDSIQMKKQIPTTKRQYQKKQILTLSRANIARCSEDHQDMQDAYSGPLLTDPDSASSYEFEGSSFFLSGDELNDDGHISGYDDWKNALSYFKESNCDGLRRSQSNASLMF